MAQRLRSVALAASCCLQLLMAVQESCMGLSLQLKGSLLSTCYLQLPCKLEEEEWNCWRIVVGLDLWIKWVAITVAAVTAASRHAEPLKKIYWEMVVSLGLQLMEVAATNAPQYQSSTNEGYTHEKRVWWQQ